MVGVMMFFMSRDGEARRWEREIRRLNAEAERRTQAMAPGPPGGEEFDGSLPGPRHSDSGHADALTAASEDRGDRRLMAPVAEAPTAEDRSKLATAVDPGPEHIEFLAPSQETPSPTAQPL